MSKIEIIKTKYNKIQKKTEFIKSVASDLEKSPLTLRHHWFGQFWAIPEEYHNRVEEKLDETIKSQKAMLDLQEKQE